MQANVSCHARMPLWPRQDRRHRHLPQRCSEAVGLRGVTAQAHQVGDSLSLGARYGWKLMPPVSASVVG
jgi:hypothetical protein